MRNQHIARMCSPGLFSAYRTQDQQRTTRSGLGHAKLGVFLALLVLTASLAGCAGQAPSADKSALPDVSFGVDAEFGVETFALFGAEVDSLGGPTITATSPANQDAFTLLANGDKASVDLVFTTANYTGNEVHCYSDGVLFGTFTVNAAPSSSTVTFTGLAKGAHTVACILLDATGQEIITTATEAIRQIKVIAPCTKDADCADGNTCTGEYCQLGTCKVQIIPNCCTSSFDCSVGSICLNPNTANSQCSACTTDTDCGDGDACTADKCDLSASKGVCTHNKTDPNCCTNALDPCSDGKPCTNDTCILPSGGGLGTCDHNQAPGACCADSECASDDVCKVGGCVAFTCRYAVNGAKPDCCSATTNSACDDKYACTQDACAVDKGGWMQCTHTKSDPTCCDPKVDLCDDGQPCTLDQCQNGQCAHTKNTQCCQNNSMCDDENLCTNDSCDVAKELCIHDPVPGCCNTNTECNDNSYCTNDYCDVPINSCKHVPLYQGCCDVDTDCNDGKVCTTDACVNHQCLGLPIYGCCDANNAGSVCNDKLFCTIDSCNLTTNKCVSIPNGVTDCCDTPATCDDQDCATLDTCNTSNLCSHKADPYACKADADCDDGKPCTADHCDVGPTGCGGCTYALIANCCADDQGCVAQDKQANAYLAVCHNAVCNTTTHFCDITEKSDCCLSDADAVSKCDDSNPCTVEYCQNYQCRHSTPPVGCCKTDAACDDGVACSTDTCNIVSGAPTGTCQYTLNGPNCAICTPTNAATFADANICTADTCVGGVPVHTPIGGCCLDKTDCDDGKPCTADTCFNKACIHSDTIGGQAVCCNPLTEATECASFNSDCTVGKCLTQVDGTLGCQATKKDACTVALSYCQDFSQSSDLSTLGWDPVNISNTAANHWGTATAGPLGPDRYANFTYTPALNNQYDTCLQSPVFLGANTANITLQFDREFMPTNGETGIRILGSTDGTLANWQNATVIDTFTATSGIGPETVDLTLPQALVGSNGLRLAFCVSGGSITTLDHFAIDNVCVVKGRPPVISACPINQVVPVGSSNITKLVVHDPDPGSFITATLTGAPAFVSMSTMSYHSFDNSWNGSLQVVPTGVPQIGEYALSLKVSDGYLYQTCNFTVTVTYQGGALVWRPTVTDPDYDIPPVMSDTVKAALTKQGQIAQVIRDLGLYPSLNKFSSVFVLLGNYPDNHVLLESEIASLKLYLAQGGKVYMEGGDTFVYDNKTTLHSFFKTKGVLEDAPNGVTGPLSGYAAFADNTLNPPKHYQWNFNQDPTFDNLNDQIAADATIQRTREILRNTGLEKFGVMVGHDDLTSKYRTIASSVPFAGVTAGTDTPDTMMKAILAFFANGFGTCAKNADCDDGDGCTADTCTAGECSNSNTCLCGGDTALGCGDNPTNIVTNSGASTNAVTTYTCDPLNSYLGHEVAYTYKSAQSKPVTVSITNVNNAGARLFVLKATNKGCDPAGCIGFGGVGNTVKFAAGKDQLYYFVVDVPGETESAKFDITVTCDPGESCTNLADDNNNNLIDCADTESCCGDAACAKEICDGIDNNCNGQVDEGCDDDGDKYCDSTYIVKPKAGGGLPDVCYTGIGDCNDLDGSVNPGMPEICLNGKDDNCVNGQDEEGQLTSGSIQYYKDADIDTWGTGNPKWLCSSSGQFKATRNGDCNDANVDVNPGTKETCDTTYDDNCDGSANDQLATNCKNYYVDIDLDGYGDSTQPFICQCVATPANNLTTKTPGDCVDSDGNINPGSQEKCNNLDDNCNTYVDEGCDDDLDQYCDANLTYVPPAPGAVPNYINACKAGPGDTDDLDPLINPLGSEVCDNKDNNSNDQTDEGCDDDGDDYCDSGIYTASTLGANNVVVWPTVCPKGWNDCDDLPTSHTCTTGTVTEACTGTNINPGLKENCATSYDDNCNGSANDQNAQACQPFFFDGDNDQWGSTSSKCLCKPLNQYKAINPGDCNEGDDKINPGAKEICDDIDNNCSGGNMGTDEGCDVDGDKFCHTGAILGTNLVGFPKVCSSGLNDCNDNNPKVNTGAAETCTTTYDDNCNDTNNDQNALGSVPFYEDLDGDTYGTSNTASFCPLLGGSGHYTSTNQADCDDTRKAVNPAALEICDNLDNNCSGGAADEGCDDDSDGQCDVNIKFVGPVTICPQGGGDCNDNPLTGGHDMFKGKSQETCDGKDDNCNGKVDDGCDDDKDGYCEAGFTVVGAPCSAVCTGQPEGTPCDDGNACTTDDQCHFGTCTPVAPTNCNDGNVCTDDACNYATGCMWSNNTAGCIDGNLCTFGESCTGGACVWTTGTVSCEDGNPCTTDSCDPGGGCVHTSVANSATCCSGLECSAGYTTCGGSGIADGGACFTDKCHVAGTCSTGATATEFDSAGSTGFIASLYPADGLFLSDGWGAAEVFVAGQTGTAVALDMWMLTSGTVHVAFYSGSGSANPTALTPIGGYNAVYAAPGKVTVSLNGGPALTAGQTYTVVFTGNAVSGSVDLDMGVDTNPAGEAVTFHTFYNGVSWQNVWTSLPTRDLRMVVHITPASSCTPGAAISCDDNNPCTTDSCDAALGCRNTANAAPCDDGNACTTGDICAAGLCTAGDAKNCSDSNTCTQDSCNSATGACSHGAVNDGLLCCAGAACTCGAGSLPDVCLKGPGDCDDQDSDRHPNAPEICDNNIDDNCNGSKNDPGAVGCSTFYFDSDGDTWGISGAPGICLCLAEGSYTATQIGDCNEGNASINPAAPEVCDAGNAIDENCDGVINEDGAQGCVERYYDYDGDGYGISLGGCSCGSSPPFTALVSGDCDDTNAAMRPSTVALPWPELCDNFDNNCNAKVDEACNKDGDKFCDIALLAAGTTFPAVCPLGGGDCNDNNPSVPGNEICDGMDNNCLAGPNTPATDLTILAGGTPASHSLHSFIAQSFVAQHTGSITAVDFYANTNNFTVQLDMYVYAGGLPGAGGTPVGGTTSLFSVTTSSQALQTFTPTAGSIRLTKGLTYYIIFNMPTAGTNGTSFDSNDTNPYLDGVASFANSLAGSYGPYSPGLVDVRMTVRMSADGLSIDEGCDDDGDQYCDADMTTVKLGNGNFPDVCTKGANDCQDTLPLINPGMAEVCGDGADNNCSGSQNDVNAQGCKQFFADYDGDTYGKGSSSFKKAMINEIHYSTTGMGGTGSDSMEILITADWTVTDMATLYFGDSQDARTGKVGAFHLNLAPLGITLLKAGTIINVGGKGAIPTEDTTYDPSIGDWNLQLWADDHLVTKDATGADLGLSDVAWIDDSLTGTTSIDSWAWTTSLVPGAFSSAAGVALTLVPSLANPTILFKSDISGWHSQGSYGLPDTGALPVYTASPGEPNGGKNTTFVTFLRTLSVTGTGQCLCTGDDLYKAEKGGDCDDGNNLKNPGLKEFCDGKDNNCDGVIDEGCDDDGDGYCDSKMTTVGTPYGCNNGGGDCDDTNAAIHPDALDICTGVGSGVDYNCDGAPGSTGSTGCKPFFYDGDGDGVGVNVSLCLCASVDKYTATVNGDCDDTNNQIAPSKPEDCNTSFDDNCNGTANDLGALHCQPWYVDGDLDGYGADGANSRCQCTGASDPGANPPATIVNYVANVGGDCNDANGAIHPNALEICDNIDNNCNTTSTAVNDVAIVTTGNDYALSKFQAQTFIALNTGYLSGVDLSIKAATAGATFDLNLYVYAAGFPGDTGATQVGTTATLHVTTTTAFQTVTIVPTGIKLTAGTTYYLIVTGAGATVDQRIQSSTTTGDPYADGQMYSSTTLAGTYTSNGTSPYADMRMALHVMTVKDEGCDDDGDGFCDGTFYRTSAALCSTGSKPPVGTQSLGDDCDDTNSARKPGAAETCDNVDNNCDGYVDDGCDADKDGYCRLNATILAGGFGLGTACSNEVATGAGRDCDDLNSAVYPGKAEWCDGVDNDCDTVKDEDCNMDGDLYCDAGKTTVAVSGGANPVWPTVCPNGGGDCNDNLLPACVGASLNCGLKINPGATEICDGIDNNCTGPLTTQGQGVDEGCQDLDGDGWCNGVQGTQTPGGMCPNGWGDCNDDPLKNGAAIHPSTVAAPWPENCATLYDDNCNGLTNEVNATNCNYYFVDTDQDGYGSYPTVPVCQCSQTDCGSPSTCTGPSGAKPNFSATIGGDCNDDPAQGGAAVHPGAIEICDSVDNNCQGTTAVDQTVASGSGTPTSTTHLYIGQTFKSGATGGTLSSVSLTFYANAAAASSDLYVYSSLGTSPGNLLGKATATVPVISNTNTVVTYALGTQVTLQANTTYALVFKLPAVSVQYLTTANTTYPNGQDSVSDALAGPYSTPSAADLVFTTNMATSGTAGIDEGCDADGDKHCAANMVVKAGSQIVGGPCSAQAVKVTGSNTTVGDDCNDGDVDIYTGHVEWCDNKDNNCAAVAGVSIDEICDVDDDNFCASTGVLMAPGLIIDTCTYTPKAAGTVGTAPTTAGDDCNDGQKSVHPNNVSSVMLEDCATPYDDDCNLTTNAQFTVANYLAQHGHVYYVDADGDTWGDQTKPGYYCVPTDTFTATQIADCNDANPLVYGGGAPEICDGIDNNCNTTIDEGCDDDKDGYCDKTMKTTAGAKTNSPPTCANTTINVVTGKGDDCDDTTILARPGFVDTSTKPERCDNVDNDCNGSTDEGCDDDGDKWCDAAYVTVGKPSIGCSEGGGDCNDLLATQHPNSATSPSVEKCNDGQVDNNCDGYIDYDPNGLGGTSGCITYYQDADQDGYPGNPALNPAKCLCDSGLSAAAKGWNDSILYTIKLSGPPLNNTPPTNTATKMDCNDVLISLTPLTVPNGGDQYPGHVEWCDNFDNDCNGVADIADTILVGAVQKPRCNKDGDSYCDSALFTKGTPAGLCAGGGGDCDDLNIAVWLSSVTGLRCNLQ